MVLVENNSLLRVLKPPRDIASAFSHFCTQRGVVVRGARICTGSRGLRGLSAKTDLPKGATVVRVPGQAMLHVGLALHDVNFREACLHQATLDLSNSAQQLDDVFPLRCRGMGHDALPDDTLTLRNHQILLAGYLAYASVTNGHPLQAYTDFLPRREGNFDDLMPKWYDALDDSHWCLSLQQTIAQPIGHASSEARPLIQWALSMLSSRQVPLQDPEWKRRVLRAAEPFDVPSPSTTSSRAEGGLSAVELLSLDAQSLPNATQLSASSLASAIPTMPVLCPVMDLCNHTSEDNENVEMDVDVDDSGGIALKLVTTAEVRAGEELMMNYGATNLQLRILWGMSLIA
ncbi:Hypothetical protein, putative [Bodo saltans]|uniref:SET domain-containing protein n=1 Tax=Bodo saltans TaxID=75058 RepID=A0A0S4JT92_BODSA|nr:Hypothetical protein, putative [Bodo saltans]|eukprot:CUG92321.1 Hypothetical protein, putative [Bodo saltans]